MFKPDEMDYLPKRPGEADITLADASLARERFGWEAKIKLEDYVNNFVQALNNSPT
jgi:GDP-D-mannose dehydratase